MAQVFPPPRLPRDFRPVHHFRPVVDLTRVSPLVAQALQESRGQMVPEQTQQTGRHQLDSGQRGVLLGESTLQGNADPEQDVTSLPLPLSYRSLT